MTVRDTDFQQTATAVRVRGAGDVDEQALAYVRTKVDAVLGRSGLPPVSGEVRIEKATAHHAGHLWTARAEIRVDRDLVVVHAGEATSHELADRLQDRLRGQVERVVHRGDAARKSATPPPWRGGPADGRQE
ncbi:hypothetical protein [Streptomyces neyagawaensis]|uniref:hypothetical protein n=1 Tax=Streptomyces neyagawaensis TaxID=42238 RepID=UPI0006E27CBD|nr:hypothetical protein [Streptomyces neyagawaensis]MCL6735878.1 hypothetical protein [Streptomyces neyagawaensis]MDE1686316.1 hypothetical protein [Streptomyces neyagawaensis]